MIFFMLYKRSFGDLKTPTWLMKNHWKLIFDVGEKKRKTEKLMFSDSFDPVNILDEAKRDEGSFIFRLIFFFNSIL